MTNLSRTAPHLLVEDDLSQGRRQDQPEAPHLLVEDDSSQGGRQDQREEALAFRALPRRPKPAAGGAQSKCENEYPKFVTVTWAALGGRRYSRLAGIEGILIHIADKDGITARAQWMTVLK